MQYLLLSSSPVKSAGLAASTLPSFSTYDHAVTRRRWRPEQPIGFRSTLDACWSRIQDAMETTLLTPPTDAD